MRFDGNGFTELKDARLHCLRRAADLAADRGARYFTILNATSGVGVSYNTMYATPPAADPGATVQPVRLAKKTPHCAVRVLCLAEPPPDAVAYSVDDWKAAVQGFEHRTVVIRAPGTDELTHLKQVNTVPAYKAYLERRPDGEYRSEVAALLEELRVKGEQNCTVRRAQLARYEVGRTTLKEFECDQWIPWRVPLLLYEDGLRVGSEHAVGSEERRCRIHYIHDLPGVDERGVGQSCVLCPALEARGVPLVAFVLREPEGELAALLVFDGRTGILIEKNVRRPTALPVPLGHGESARAPGS